MSRRQLPRHRKRSRANKPAVRPAAVAVAEAAQPQPAAVAEAAQPDLDGFKAELRLIGDRWQAEREDDLSLLLYTWSFLDPRGMWDDVLRMIRSQILAHGGPLRCEKSDVVQIRQRRLGDPLDPVAVPRPRLACPLEEDLRFEKRPIPCTLHVDPPKRGTYAALPEAVRAALEEIRWREISPCKTILESSALDEIFLDRGPAPEVAPSLTLPERAARLLSMDQAHLSADDLRSQLGFLLDSGRFTRTERFLLLERHLYTPDRGWISCRDDEQRTSFYLRPGDGEDDLDAEGNNRWWEIEKRKDTLICPLQHRALLGDRTVPCAYALERQAESDLIEAARINPPPEGRPEGELPQSWTTPDQAPGQEGDLVRRLRILPCHIVGRLLSLELPAALARRLIAVRSEEERRLASPAQQEAGWPG